MKSAGAEVAYDLTPVESKKLVLEKLNTAWWLPEAGEGSKEGRWAEGTK